MSTLSVDLDLGAMTDKELAELAYDLAADLDRFHADLMRDDDNSRHPALAIAADLLDQIEAERAVRFARLTGKL